MAVAPREAVAEVAGTDLRYRQPAGGHDHGAGRQRAAVGVELERGGTAPHVVHRARLPARHAAGLAFAQQHGDDLVARSVAEELALVLLVERNPVALYE